MNAGSERQRTFAVRNLLQGTRFEQVQWVDRTRSTNADLLHVAQAGGPEQALITELQTAGRGRRGRVWQAPAGSSLMFSVLVRNADVSAGFWHVGAVALAAAEAASAATGAMVELKWPNDLVIGDKKLAGILAQRNGDALVIGMGMNVLWQADMPDEFAARATSLDRHLDQHAGGVHQIDRIALAGDVLTRAATWLAAPVSDIRKAWVRRCATMDKPVRIMLEHGDELGTAVDVDPSGALVVDQGGTCVTFHVGDVVHLRPNNGSLSG